MVFARLSFIGLCGIPVIPAQPLAPPPVTKNSIDGQVVDSVTGSALRKAWVRLEDGRRIVGARQADLSGRFHFDDVPAGTLQLVAEAPGYISLSVQATSPVSYPVEVSVVEGQAVGGVVVRLVPTGSVSGRLTDTDGDPWPYGSVSLYRAVWKRGRRQMTFQDLSTVNERGEFQISRLTPGRYYLSAVPDGAWDRTNRPEAPERYQTTWYPGVLDSNGALPIVLAAGERRDRLEIPVETSPGYRVEGRVTGMDQLPSLPQGGAAKPILTVERVDEVVRMGAGGVSIAEDGSFELNGLRPGSYDFILRQGNFAIKAGGTRVELRQGDLEDIEIPVVPPFPLPVQVEWEEGSSNDRRVRIQIASVDGESTLSMNAGADGRLQFPSIGPGKYFITAQGPDPENRPYVKSIRQGTYESREGMIDVSSGEQLEVILGTNGGNVIGNMQPGPDGKPAAVQPRVWLIPETTDPILREANARFAVFDQQGVFRIRNIRPGSYRILAWSGLPDDIWQDSDALARLEPAATPVRLEEGQYARLILSTVPQAIITGIQSELGLTQ